MSKPFPPGKSETTFLKLLLLWGRNLSVELFPNRFRIIPGNRELAGWSSRRCEFRSRSNRYFPCFVLLSKSNHFLPKIAVAADDF
jgi:hypothetical protein